MTFGRRRFGFGEQFLFQAEPFVDRANHRASSIILCLTFVKHKKVFDTCKTCMLSCPQAIHTRRCAMRDHRVNVRLPVWLYDDLKRCAEAWDGDVSKQI